MLRELSEIPLGVSTISTRVSVTSWLLSLQGLGLDPLLPILEYSA